MDPSKGATSWLNGERSLLLSRYIRASAEDRLVGGSTSPPFWIADIRYRHTESYFGNLRMTAQAENQTVVPVCLNFRCGRKR